MEAKLAELQRRALQDPDLRARLLATRQTAEPLEEFCAVCRSLGYVITPGDILSMGETFHAAMLRSVNGGGVEAPDDGWIDAYEQFFAAL